MDKKTVIYIGGFELPDKNAAAPRVLNNAKIFRDLDYHVVLIGMGAGCEAAIEKSRKEYEGFECWSVCYHSPRERFQNQMELEQYLPVLRKYGDIATLILYNYPAWGLYRFQRFCRKNKIALIADCTEWYPVPRGNPVNKILKWADTYTRMVILQKRVDGVICISKYLQKYYQKYTKTVYVPALADSRDQQWQKKEREPSSCIKLVYSGSPGRQKDKIDKIIEGLYDCRECDFLFQIVGITKAQFLEYYPQQAEILSELVGKIEFLGRVQHSLALEYVRQADFTIFFRDQSRVSMAGFPTKFVESITAKTPVITNMTSNLTDYLVDGVNGFFVENHQDITHTLKLVFSLNQEQIAQMHENCDAELFDYRNYTAAVSCFLEDVLHGKH